MTMAKAKATAMPMVLATTMAIVMAIAMAMAIDTFAGLANGSYSVTWKLLNTEEHGCSKRVPY